MKYSLLNLGVVLTSLAASVSANASLLITVVGDTPSGSHPRVLEVVATEDIADTSDFFFIRQTNGSGTITDTQFASFALSEGDFAYITTGGDSTTFLTDNTFGPILASVSSWNGDDILGISSTNEATADASDDAGDLADMIDSFGLFGQADTDFYADGISVRQEASVTGTGDGLLDASNFDFTASASISEIETQLSDAFGIFVVPEPASLALVGLGGLVMLGRGRRQA